MRPALVAAVGGSAEPEQLGSHFLSLFLLAWRTSLRDMGFRQAAVLSSVCFFLGIAVNRPAVHAADAAVVFAGVLFICLNVDYRVLFSPLIEEVVRDGMEFYSTFFRSPPAIKVRITPPFATLNTNSRYPGLLLRLMHATCDTRP